MRALAPLLLLLLIAPPARATHGMNPLAFSARSAGLGGADLALAWQTQAMNTNPAGITRLGYRLDFSGSLMMPNLTLDDRVITAQGIMPLNEEKAGESLKFPLINAGFTTRAWEDLHVGLGFYVQGGMGSQFKGIATMVDDDPENPMGPTDQPSPATYDIESQVMYMKLTPSLAWRFRNLGGVDLSIGAALNLGFATMSFKHTGMQFPEMDMDHMYFAHSVDYESDVVWGFAGRVGVLAELLDGALSFGAAYQSEALLPFKGTTTIDEQLEYDSQMDFGWPGELGLGAALRPHARLLLAADVKWVNWSSTMGTVTLDGTAKGQAPPGYEVIKMPFQLNWSDQVVLNSGGELQIFDGLAIRGGYSWGQNPVGGDGINPLFPAVTTHHMTFGVGLQPIKRMEIDIALEVVPQNKVASDAQSQLTREPTPTGDGDYNGYQTEVGMSQLTLHLAMGYQF
ncbi:outer membrane protein transport protein [Myxococcota bacterium]|nr:outer membrane protein transport protein [Myxococcota bacterium]MBU1429056.1 outer membrane protein transport protein [Myxococcota bacterium]MBU1899439.1 outer membrane protein transport protein [Myxococcota bacterium]